MNEHVLVSEDGHYRWSGTGWVFIPVEERPLYAASRRVSTSAELAAALASPLDSVPDDSGELPDPFAALRSLSERPLDDRLLDDDAHDGAPEPAPSLWDDLETDGPAEPPRPARRSRRKRRHATAAPVPAQTAAVAVLDREDEDDAPAEDDESYERPSLMTSWPFFIILMSFVITTSVFIGWRLREPTVWELQNSAIAAQNEQAQAVSDADALRAQVLQLQQEARAAEDEVEPEEPVDGLAGEEEDELLARMDACMNVVNEVTVSWNRLLKATDESLYGESQSLDARIAAGAAIDEAIAALPSNREYRQCREAVSAGSEDTSEQFGSSLDSDEESDDLPEDIPEDTDAQ